MSNSDGKVVINTALDTSGIKKDLQTVSKTVEKQMNSISKSIENTTTKIDVQKSKLEKLKTSYENATNVKSKNKIQEQIEGTTKTITNLESKLGTLNSRLSGLNSKSALNGLDGQFRSASVSIVDSLDKIEKKAKTTNTSVNTSLSTMGDTIGKAGSKISSVGNTLTMGVTAPLVGVGIAAAKVGMDFDAAMSRVKAISGATGEDFTDLKNQAIDLGGSTAFSAKEAASGMENLASAGFNTKEIMTAMPGMLDLAASSGEDLASSADIAASTLRGFGLSADQAGHVADVLAKNAGATNAAVRDTGEAMKYIAPVAQEAGWSLESVTAAIGEMANSGIKGSSSGTTLRSMFSSLVKPSKEAAEAMDAMGFKAYGANGKMKSLSTLITDLGKSTSKMTTQQRENTIATLFGQEAMSGILTLIKSGSGGLDELTDSYKNSDGAAKAMAKTMQENAKSAVEQMVGSMETAAIKVEESFAPAITEIANTIGNLADQFSKLTPEQQMFYVKMLGGAAAIGPVVKLVGGLTSGIGGVVNILSKFAPTAATATVTMGGLAEAGTVGAGGVAALGTSMGGLIAAAAPFALAAGIIGTAGYGIYEEMTKEVVPSVDLFADKVTYASETVQTQYGEMQKLVETSSVKISDSTKKAVQSYLDMDNNAKKYLQDLYINNSTITDQIVNDSKSKFDSMAKTTIAGYEKQKNDGISKLQELFNSEKSLTTEEQAEILKKTTDYYTNKETKTQENEARINEIIANAKNENRSLKSEELTEIQSLENSMRDNAVNALSSQESEAAVILQRIKDYDERITAEQASEKIKALNDSRDKTIQVANDEYDKKIKVITDMRDNVGSITTDEADKMIEEAKRQRDDTVQAAKDTKDGAVEKIQEMNSTISSEVDTNTGKILTNWDKLKIWWNSWAPEPKTVTVTTEEQAVAKGFSNSSFNNDFNNSNKYLQIGQNYTGTNGSDEGLSYVNEHGWEISSGANEIAMLGSGSKITPHMTSVNEMNQEISSQIGTTLTPIMKILTNVLGQVANNTGAIKNYTKETASNIIDSMNSKGGTFSNIQSELDNASYAKSNANNLSIEDNQSYIDAKAEVDRISDMTTDAKKALGDEQYKILKDNAEKELEFTKKTAELDIIIAKQNAEQQVKIAEAKKDKLIKISEATATAIKNNLEEEKAAAEKVHNDRLKQLETEYNNEVSNIDKVAKRKTTKIDKQLKALEEATTATSRNDERKSTNDNINMLTTKMNNTASVADKRALALQIAEAQKGLSSKETAWSIEDKKAELEAEKAKLAEEADAKKANLQEEYENQKANEEEKLKVTDEYYNKLLETDSINAQARYTLLNSSSEQLVSLLNSYAPGWQDAGQSLGDSLLTGLNSSKESVQAAINDMISMRGSSSDTSLDGYATGTSNNTNAGLYNVDEKGWETSSGSVAYVSKGAAIKNHMQSVADMKAEITRQVASMRSSIQAEQSQMKALIVGNMTKGSNSSVINNDNGLTLAIENYNQYSSQDTEQLAHEFYSYGKKKEVY